MSTTSSGNPDPVYDPEFAAASEGTPYVNNPVGVFTPPNGPGAAAANVGNAYQPQGTIYGQFPIPTSGNPDPIYGPNYALNARGIAYQSPGQTFNDKVVPTNTGNPDPSYNPGFAAKIEGQAYLPNGQVNDSAVLTPIIVFQVNLETVNRQGQLVPNRTYLAGNETVSEADNQKFTRQLWIPDMIVNDDGTTGGTVAIEGIAGIINNRNNPQGYLHHGDQFTVKGAGAIYLKKLYVSNPPSPADLLIVVSQS